MERCPVPATHHRNHLPKLPDKRLTASGCSPGSSSHLFPVCGTQRLILCFVTAWQTLPHHMPHRPTANGCKLWQRQRCTDGCILDAPRGVNTFECSWGSACCLTSTPLQHTLCGCSRALPHS